MNFRTEYLDSSHLAEAIDVEKKTMGNYTYLKDAYTLYQKSPGELIGVYDEEKLIGIGRFTVLADKTGWLECLRVIPEYQHKGAGKLIYEEYLKLAGRYNCSSIAMYTGEKNIASSSLAEKYGLFTIGHFTGFHFKPELTESSSFIQLTPEKCDTLMQYKENYHDCLSVSRTFYHYNIENLSDFASMGMVYKDSESDSYIIAGARFQHHKTLHVALMEGDYQKCLAFIRNLAALLCIDDICFTLSVNNPLCNILMDFNAAADNSDIIVKELKF